MRNKEFSLMKIILVAGVPCVCDISKNSWSSNIWRTLVKVVHSWYDGVASSCYKVTDLSKTDCNVRNYVKSKGPPLWWAAPALQGLTLYLDTKVNLVYLIDLLLPDWSLQLPPLTWKSDTPDLVVTDARPIWHWMSGFQGTVHCCSVEKHHLPGKRSIG